MSRRNLIIATWSLRWVRQLLKRPSFGISASHPLASIQSKNNGRIVCPDQLSPATFKRQRLFLPSTVQGITLSS